MKNLLTLIIILGVGYLVYQGVNNNDNLDLPARSDSIEILTENEPSEVMSEEQKQTMKAIFTTNKGTFEIELFNELAPKTVENFVTLAESDFYNDVKFHRVIKNFMIQAGDPQSKDDDLSDLWGTGGPGYKFEDELPQSGDYKIGSLAMANSGPDTNGSQFFIVTGSDGVGLPPLYSLFGQVTEGLEVALAIQEVEIFPGDRPVEPVVIESISITK